MVRELLKKAAQNLENSETPMLDARVLLAYSVGKSDAALVFDMPDDKQLELFWDYIEKRKKGTPVAYITGEKEFMGLTFKLNKDTLIPRPDTECLVEKVIELSSMQKPKILDLCTGSGCIGISLAHFIKGSTVALTDIADGAISAAKENAKLNGVDERAEVFRLNVLEDAICQGFDIIVSNPPYIKTDVMKTLEVSEFEPNRALDGGKDGLIFYRVISKKAYDALEKGGILAFEIGYDQGKDVTELLSDFSSVKLYKDYGGNDRVIVAVK